MCTALGLSFAPLCNVCVMSLCTFVAVMCLPLAARVSVPGKTAL